MARRKEATLQSEEKVRSKLVGVTVKFADLRGQEVCLCQAEMKGMEKYLPSLLS